MEPQNPIVRNILERDLEKARKAHGPKEPETEQEWIGARLRMAMAYRKVTAVALSKKTGISRQTIWRYSAGKVAQQFEPMAAFAKALNVSLDYFANGGDITEMRA